MNITNILAPVDFSPPSILAVNYAVSLARKFRAKLTLMHAIESLSTDPLTSEAAPEKKQYEQVLRMLSGLVASEDQGDLDLRIVVKSGDIKEAISKVIREQHVDIVVMGTHGRGLIGRWLIGSITAAMLRKTSIPILTVCRATKPLTANRILLATDLSDTSKHAFRFALDLARAMRSDLVIVHAIDQTPLSYGSADLASYVNQHNMEEAKTKLGEFVVEGTRAKIKIDAVLVQGVAAEEILRAAEQNVADLVLLTVKEKGLIERALLGTTAERVIREADVPVLSIPADGETVLDNTTNA